MKISIHIMTLIVLSMTAAIAGLAASTGLNPSTVFANHEFAANLTGQQEVPPVNTQATGEAMVVPLNQTVSYYVNVTDIEGVTAGHIHSGTQGENGPVVVTLFTFDSPQNGVSQSDNVTAANLEGPMQGKTIPDLVSAMKNGSTYVNVHTEQNPNGEVRGQLVDIP